jgi:hypothetical protein
LKVKQGKCLPEQTTSPSNPSDNEGSSTHAQRGDTQHTTTKVEATHEHNHTPQSLPECSGACIPYFVNTQVQLLKGCVVPAKMRHNSNRVRWYPSKPRQKRDTQHFEGVAQTTTKNKQMSLNIHAPQSLSERGGTCIAYIIVTKIQFFEGCVVPADMNIAIATNTIINHATNAPIHKDKQTLQVGRSLPPSNQALNILSERVAQNSARTY